MRGRVALLGVALAGIAVACSVVDDGKVERIDPPLGLDDTVPSTTEQITTTTELATTTSGLEAPTTLGVETEPVTLYFVATGKLTPVQQDLASPVTLQQIISALQKGPPDSDVGIGLTTIVPDVPDLIRVTTANGVANVTLPIDFFELVPVAIDQRLVIAQLVLTLTSSRGIGQVTFNLRVPLPLGQERPPGQQLTFSDYVSMTDSNPPGPDITAGTTTSTTLGG